MRRGPFDPVRVAVVGDDVALASHAAALAARGLAGLTLIGGSPTAGAEIAGSVRGARGGRDLGDAAGCRVVLLAGAAARGAGLRGAAACIARFAPESVVVIAGPGSNAAAIAFLRDARLPAHRVLAVGGLAGQRSRAVAIAARLGVSRSQIGVLVVGDEGRRLRELERYRVVAGIPVRHLEAPARAPGEPVAEGGPAPPDAGAPEEGSGSRAAAAALLVETVARDRRRVLCCGARLDGVAGLPTCLVTFPTLVGAHGAAGPLPVPLGVEDRAYLIRAAAAIEETAAPGA